MADRPKEPFSASVTDAETLQRLQRLLARKVKNAQDAEDLMQELQLILLTSEAAQRAEKPATYLSVVAHNLAKGFLSRNHRGLVTYDSEMTDGVAASLASTEDICERLSSQEQVEAVLEEMPESYRRVLIMQYCEGFTQQEIADRLGCRLDAVKKQVVRALVFARKKQWK